MKTALLPVKLPYGLWDLTLEKKLQLNRELTQQRWRQLRKRHLKSEFALLQTLSRLFQLVQFVKCWQIFWSRILKYCIEVQEKKKKSLFCIHVLDKM